jgi:hypothetical protein
MSVKRLKKRDNDFGPIIRRARFEQLTIYDVTDSELDILEKGSPESLYLNFAIFLLSMAISFFIALITTEVKSLTTFIVLVILSIIGLLGGAFLFLLWSRDRSSVSRCIKAIRDRLPPEEGKQEITT